MGSVKNLLAVTTVGALACTTPAVANVTYDVTIDYSPSATLTFSMEFATGAGVKSATDLIGGDFTGESLVIGGVPFTLFEDLPTFNLLFNPSLPANVGFSFTSGDGFSGPSLTCHQETQLGVFCSNSTLFLNLGSASVVLRDSPAQVPEPGVLWLALGLPGLLVALRRGKGTSLQGSLRAALPT
jgi:hypothetical protein